VGPWRVERNSNIMGLHEVKSPAMALALGFYFPAQGLVPVVRVLFRWQRGTELSWCLASST
jgi:hypothetical protein